MTHRSAYSRAGVDIDAGNRAVALMKVAVRSTFTAAVLSDLGSFGGLFDAAGIKDMSAPILVASTDSVGTKTKVAARFNRWDTLGQDLVNHCINDILVQGASPLFFMDYVAAAHLDPEQVAILVGGMAQACRAASCALLGGETAELPGVYEPGEVDVVGTIVGIVERDQLLGADRVQPGDVIVGMPSTGLHTNGYSLARAALADQDWQITQSDLGCSIGEALLEIHRSYLEAVQKLRTAGVDLHALAHITGGGIVENLPRVLPPGVGATIRRGAWPELPIFGLIQRAGDVAAVEMFRVFNMGLGMLAVLPSQQAALAVETLEGAGYIVGEISTGRGGVAVEWG